MDTRDQQTRSDPTPLPTSTTRSRGSGPGSDATPALLMRLFMVMVFTFGASTTAANFSYGLQGDPTQPEHRATQPRRATAGDGARGLRRGHAAPRVIGPTPEQIGHPGVRDSRLLALQRGYFYFGLEETGDNLLIQTAQTPPDVDGDRRAGLARQARHGRHRDLPRHDPERARGRRPAPATSPSRS